MEIKAYLTRVMEDAHLDNLRQADSASRVVIGMLKAVLPADLVDRIASFLPESLRSGWEGVVAYPSDILEREDFYFEGEGTESIQVEATITQG